MNKELSAAQAFEGMRASLRNAEALIEEAKILADANHPARAVALAVLAYEELGKLPGYFAADDCAKEGRMKIWWDTFRSHSRKIATHNQLALALIVGQLDPETVERVISGKAAKWLHELKMAALYTDFRKDSFVCPLDMPDAAEVAQSTIHMAECSLGLHRATVDRLSAEHLQSHWDRRDERRANVEKIVEQFDLELARCLGEERYSELVLEFQKSQERPGKGPGKA